MAHTPILPFGSLTNAGSASSPAGRAQRAVVIGAGIGGLVAASALARHFADVVIVERDALPADPEPRKGVPHGRHVHGLLAQGCQTIDRLLPGVLDDLVAAGAQSGDALEVVRWYHGGGYHARATAGFPAVIASRALIEHAVRVRLLRLPNVRVIDGTGVEELVWDQARNRITGVRISGATVSADGTLPATLVIDASGRGSRLPAWLEDAGFPAPDASRVEIGIRYATRSFGRRPDQLPGSLLAASVARPGHPHGGLALAIEGDRWLVSISGRHGEQPPTDLTGFIAYAATLEAPDIHDLVRVAEPIDDGTTYAFQRSTRHHYERLERLPEGVVPFGDAICSFNPIYGQGMTVAALEAEALDSCLHAGLDGLATRFLAATMPIVEGAWRMSTGADHRFTTPDDALPPQVREMNAYLDRLHLAAHHDAEVAKAFCAVMHLMASPETLMQPGMVARVMSPAPNPAVDPARQVAAD